MTDTVAKLEQMYRLSQAWSDSDVLLDAVDEIKRLRRLVAELEKMEDERESREGWLGAARRPPVR